ncbi:MAG: 16S rRNA (cytosine(1402)-N(4))-methyltransferase RsmH, partial [Alistipes sp.]|nr:16S rRNA (cytosine(1402)-N(4))-methyltransferase RsmH [Alistipes sp.]
MSNYHIPVLAEESLEALDIRPDGSYADLTFGGGGHSRLILSRLGEGGRLWAFDQDADAAANVPDDARLEFIAGNFRFMRGHLRAAGAGPLDGILADLGVSSHHFDTPERGFSFRFDAPLDMRMNTSGGRTAADIVNTYTEDDLGRILAQYGELGKPYRLARQIIARRGDGPITTIGGLVEAVERHVPEKARNKFLSKLFQALRIEVNGEVEALKMMLEQSLKVLKPGGRLVVISYHSLEDRLVKNFMRSGTFDGQAEKDFYGRTSSPWKPVTRKAVAPSDGEIAANPRARSARIRAAEKIYGRGGRAGGRDWRAGGPGWR